MRARESAVQFVRNTSPGGRQSAVCASVGAVCVIVAVSCPVSAFRSFTGRTVRPFRTGARLRVINGIATTPTPTPTPTTATQRQRTDTANVRAARLWPVRNKADIRRSSEAPTFICRSDEQRRRRRRTRATFAYITCILSGSRACESARARCSPRSRAMLSLGPRSQTRALVFVCVCVCVCVSVVICSPARIQWKIHVLVRI